MGTPCRAFLVTGGAFVTRMRIAPAQSPLAPCLVASVYAQSRQLEDARAEAADVLRVNPAFTIERYKRLVVHKDPKDAEHRLDGLRKAGLPEN